jgi:hypothetical protein
MCSNHKEARTCCTSDKSDYHSSRVKASMIGPLSITFWGDFYGASKAETSQAPNTGRLCSQTVELKWAIASAKSDMRHFRGSTCLADRNRRVSYLGPLAALSCCFLPAALSPCSFPPPATHPTLQRGRHIPPSPRLMHLTDDGASTHLQTPTVSLASHSSLPLNTCMSTAVPDPNLQFPLLAKSAASDVQHKPTTAAP